MTPVAAATDQGLEWGVQNGDRFYFNMHENSDGTVVNEALCMTVVSRPSIANGISNWAAMPGVNLDLYWANGSSMGFSVLIFLGIAFVNGEFCFPVGNWTLLTELRSSDPDATITDSIFFWGFSCRGTFFDPELQIRLGVEHEKRRLLGSLHSRNHKSNLSRNHLHVINHETRSTPPGQHVANWRRSSSNHRSSSCLQEEKIVYRGAKAPCPSFFMLSVFLLACSIDVWQTPMIPWKLLHPRS